MTQDEYLRLSGIYDSLASFINECCPRPDRRADRLEEALYLIELHLDQMQLKGVEA